LSRKTAGSNPTDRCRAAPWRLVYEQVLTKDEPHPPPELVTIAGRLRATSPSPAVPRRALSTGRQHTWARTCPPRLPGTGLARQATAERSVLTPIIRAYLIATVDGIGKHCLAGLLLFSVTLLPGACGSREQRKTPGQVPATSASTLATPTTGAPLPKPCLLYARSPARPFWFRTSAGALLVGVMLGRGRTGLVLAHGYGLDLCEWFPQGQAFAGLGYRVLAFDFEGYGESQLGSGPDARIDTDVVAAAEELRRRGADRIVLLGSSMGAMAALSAATRVRPPVAGW
jgi:Alpha/beta hydrolase family